MIMHIILSFGGKTNLKGPNLMFMADIQYYNILFNSKVEHKIWNKVDTKGELPVTQIFISLNFVQTRFREIKNRKHNIFYRNCKFLTK